MRKRTFIWITILLVLLLGLTGCGSEKEEAPKEPPKEEQEAVSPASIEGETATKQAIKEPKMDEYLTAPPPEGKPSAVEPENAQIDKETAYTCTVSIVCDTVLDHMEDLTEGKEDLIPEDGVILSKTKVKFYEGENAFDVLLRATQDNKIHMEFVKTPFFNSNYIEGINNLYEFDCGPLSGWMYKVNDWYPNYGCSRYQLEDGDAVLWVYSCDLGRDVGGDMYSQRDKE